jgi:hypothetical protein
MTQLTVSCENRPGTLAEIKTGGQGHQYRRRPGILGKAKVNILAFSASSAGAMGYVQLIVNNTNRAKKALKPQGISCYEEQVLHVTLPNVPGALSRFASKLAAKDINIGAGYQTTVEDGKRASVVLSVSHLASADRIR